MSGPKQRLRVVCFSPYPPSAPSVHHRIAALTGIWAEHGVSVCLWPFMSERFYKIRRRFGLLATLMKAAYFAMATLRLLARLPRIRRYDRVIIHREIFPFGPPVVEQCVARLHPDVTFDLDDAMWHAPSSSVNQRAVFQDPTRTARIMTCSTRVIAGSTYVRDYALQFNSNVTTIPTSFDDLAGRQRRPGQGDRPIVVWIGNLGNAHYVTAVLAALERASGECPFVLRLVGGADIFSVESGVLDIERLEWSRDNEPAWLVESDMGIMPLPSNDFERGKCAFKIIQYCSAGLPSVASPVGMNREVIDHGTNGYLAETANEWTECILALLRDPARRRDMGAAAHATYLSRFTRRANAELWLDVLRPEWRRDVMGSLPPDDQPASSLRGSSH